MVALLRKRFFRAAERGFRVWMGYPHAPRYLEKSLFSRAGGAPARAGAYVARPQKIKNQKNIKSKNTNIKPRSRRRPRQIRRHHASSPPPAGHRHRRIRAGDVHRRPSPSSVRGCRCTPADASTSAAAFRQPARRHARACHLPPHHPPPRGQSPPCHFIASHRAASDPLPAATLSAAPPSQPPPVERRGEKIK